MYKSTLVFTKEMLNEIRDHIQDQKLSYFLNSIENSLVEIDKPIRGKCVAEKYGMVEESFPEKFAETVRKITSNSQKSKYDDVKQKIISAAKQGLSSCDFSGALNDNIELIKMLKNDGFKVINYLHDESKFTVEWY